MVGFLLPKEALRLRLYLDACCLNRLTDDQSQTAFGTKPKRLKAFFAWYVKDRQPG